MHWPWEFPPLWHPLDEEGCPDLITREESRCNRGQRIPRGPLTWGHSLLSPFWARIGSNERGWHTALPMHLSLDLCNTSCSSSSGHCKYLPSYSSPATPIPLSQDLKVLFYLSSRIHTIYVTVDKSLLGSEVENIQLISPVNKDAFKFSSRLHISLGCHRIPSIINPSLAVISKQAPSLLWRWDRHRFAYLRKIAAAA